MINAKPANILIVDDDDTMRLTLGDILSLEGYHVHLAANGQSACQMLQASFSSLIEGSPVVHYDLMILDLKMPVMDGEAVLHWLNLRKEEICSSPKTSHLEKFIPTVILLTAHGSMESAISALRLGAVDYLLKPVSPPDILANVAQSLAKHQSELQKSELLERLLISQKPLPGKADGSESRKLPEQPGVLYYNELVFDLSKREISIPDAKIRLTYSESKLMEVLFSHPGQVFSHKELVKLVQGYPVETWEAPEVLRPLVSRLRQKLTRLKPKQGPITQYELWIDNVRSTGYVFEKPEDKF